MDAHPTNLIREIRLTLNVKTCIAIAQNRPNTRILFVANRVDQIFQIFGKENLKPRTKDDNQIHFSNGSCITVRDPHYIAKIKSKYNEVVIDECLDMHTKNMAIGLLLPNKGIKNGERA